MNIIELAREAGMTITNSFADEMFIAVLTRFAHLVRAQTLEEAAGVCDNSASHCHHDGLLQVVLKSNAVAIRQLKDKT